MLICTFSGDSPTSASTTNSTHHRRQITGYVNNHRPVPPMTTATPPRRSSINEQPVTSAAHRLSLSKKITTMNNETTEIQSPTKT